MMAPNPTNPNKDNWSSEVYTGQVAPFVAQLTTTVVTWLNPQRDDVVLDIGCGDGVLTAALAPQVAGIVGIDASPNMIQALQRTHPEIEARVVDCRYLAREHDLIHGHGNDIGNHGNGNGNGNGESGRFTKLFSNAALHWILRDQATRASFFSACYDALQPGGVFVSESGGLGNVAEVQAALIMALIHRGVSPAAARAASPWFFPSLEAMRTLLEAAGFEWIRGEIEYRPTKLTDTQGGGIEGWVRLFGADLAQTLPSETAWDDAVQDVVQALEGVGRRQHDGGFQINYVRLRFEVRKPA